MSVAALCAFGYDGVSAGEVAHWHSGLANVYHVANPSV